MAENLFFCCVPGLVYGIVAVGVGETQEALGSVGAKTLEISPDKSEIIVCNV